jgi:hypothetical protein
MRLQLALALIVMADNEELMNIAIESFHKETEGVEPRVKFISADRMRELSDKLVTAKIKIEPPR